MKSATIAAFFSFGCALLTLAPTMELRAAELLDIGPLVLPAATLGEPYDTQLSASGGEAPYRFRARRRRRHWPRGLKVLRDGRITGTPKKTGTFTFRVRMRDSGRPRVRSVRTVQIEVREVAAWSASGTAGVTPPVRWGHASALDAKRNRLITFGGGSGVNWLSDVVSLDLETGAWSELAGTAAGPIGRWGHSLVIDEQGDRAILFGGASVAPYSDVWGFDLGSGVWTEIEPQGIGPSARRSHFAVYDPAERRMLVFGGFDTAHRNDVWSLDLDAPGAARWSLVETLGTPPSGREFVPGAFDRVRGRVVVVGGSTAAGLSDSVFALDMRAAGGPVWSELTLTGDVPSPRSGSVVIADAARDRLLLFGGQDATGLRGELYALDFTGADAARWTLLQPEGTGGPSPRTSATGGIDAVTARVFIAFGNDGALRDDAFVIEESADVVPPRIAWTTTDPAGPTARMNHSLVVDPTRRRAIVFGGFDGAYVGDTWSLDISDLGAPRFTALTSSGPAPAVRFAHSANLDADRDRMLLVFGSDGTSGVFEYFNDVWSLDLAAAPGVADWSLIDVGAGAMPPPRDEHVSVLDRPNKRLVIFGGFDDVTVFDDVWVLDLSTAGSASWTQISPAGDAPVGRAGATAVYDPVGRRMLVHGGGDGNGFLDDLWALDLSIPGQERWEQLARNGAPAGRSLHVLALDPSGPSLALLGGQALSPFSDLSLLPLDGSGTPIWMAVTPVTGSVRSLSSAASDVDAATGSVIIHGGLGPARRSEVHVLQRP